MQLMAILSGIFANLAIGIVALRRKSLSYPSGFVAAALVGFSLFFASVYLWIALVLFFTTSSVLSKFKNKDEFKLRAMEFAEKGDQRDGIQVLANGGASLLFAWITMYLHGIFISDLTFPFVVGAFASLAASTADTWSTEMGTTSKQSPVLIYRPWVKVSSGTSGGVTLKGTVASFAGSLLIGGSAGISLFLLFGTNLGNVWSLFLIISILGFFGGIVDSLLGGLIQGLYHCPSCNKPTEKRFHPSCQTVATHIKGLEWINNDAVNFIASFFSGLIAIVLSYSLWPVQ